MTADDLGMTTTVTATRKRWSPNSLGNLRISVWQAVILSRLLVLAAGSAGALAAPRVPGWQKLDPYRLSSSLGAVGNVLAASVVRWDAIGYVNIAAHGYPTASSTTLFPLFPTFVHVLGPVVQSPVIAGVMINLSAFALGLLLLHRLACEHLGSRVADTTVLLVAFAPWSFVFSADYTTSLLLMWSAATFYLAERGRFVPACMAAAAATVTHVQGILLVAPLAIFYWTSRERSFVPHRLWSVRLLALALPPLSLAGFFFYLHTRGYGWFSPIASQNETNVGRALVGPPATIFYALKDTFVGLRQQLAGTAPPIGGLPLGTQNVIYLVVLAISLLALVVTWRRLPRAYGVYALSAILLCTSSAVTLEPLRGFDRYMLPIFPLWIGAAVWVTERRMTVATLTLSSAMLVMYTVEFTRWMTVF